MAFVTASMAPRIAAQNDPSLSQAPVNGGNMIPGPAPQPVSQIGGDGIAGMIGAVPHHIATPVAAPQGVHMQKGQPVQVRRGFHHPSGRFMGR
jgi:hypothetical protein